MRRTAVILTILTAGLLGPPATAADEVTLDTVPPVVVKAVPEAAASDVDPTLTEVKITFS